MSGPKFVLGIDPGERTGWATFSYGELVESGVHSLKTSRHESKGMRFIKLRASLTEMLKAYGAAATIVAYEEVRRHNSVDAAHAYGGYVAVIQSVCADMGVEYLAIPVGTIKKHATGKGNAGKPDMVAAAAKRWPEHEFVDDNEADAAWIASAACHELGIKPTGGN